MPDDDLEPLITECPSCLTRFRVSEAQLERARGRVRCGACLTVFHGVEHLAMASGPGAVDQVEARQALDDLLDELASGTAPAEPAAASSTAAPGSGAAVKAQRRSRARLFAGFEDAGESGTVASPAAGLAPAAQPPTAGQAAAGKVSAPPEAPEEPGPDGRVPAVTAPAESTPAERVSGERAPAEKAPGEKAPAEVAKQPAAPPQPARRRRPPAPAPGPSEAAASSGRGAPAASVQPVVFGEPRRRRPLLWFGGGLAVLLLAVQVLWYRFDDWAVDPGWRPLYAVVCGVIGCDLPVQRDASQLALRNLVVRIHPDRAGTLQVNAVIVNGADFEQPFPALELQFTTVRGNLVASRRFEPDEYLAGDAAGLILIPPRTPVQVELAVDDPGPAAVNYRLNFR